jgi:hypothetical protein
MAYRDNSPTWSFPPAVGLDVGLPLPDIAQSSASTDVPELSDFKLPSDQVGFDLLTDKSFPHPVQPHLIAASTSRRLIAVVTGDKQLECFRYDGSRAFWYRKAGQASIVGLIWHKQRKTLRLRISAPY